MTAPPRTVAVVPPPPLEAAVRRAAGPPTGATGLLLATALAVCVLFTLEDPTVVAARQHLRDGAAERWWTHLGIDVVLAVTMVAYNVAASRLVVRTAGAAAVLQAADELAAGERRGRARRFDPFRLISAAARRAGAALERLGDRAARRCHRRIARLAGDLARVNVLGVPGASLDRVRRGEHVSRRQSGRDTVLFVASWFVGAWCIERVVVTVEDAPFAGAVVTGVVTAVGTTYATLTDVTRPIGQLAVATVLALVVRHAVRVERRARALR